MNNNFKIHKFTKPNPNTRLSIITVVKDDTIGLLSTMDSLKKLNSYLLETVVWINSTSNFKQEHIDIAITNADVVICGDDLGIFDAMNKALSYANGTYVLFLNARDRIINPFIICNLNEPVLVPIQYTDYFGKTRLVKVSKSTKLGIPYCHQGMILPRLGYQYDTNFKYGADYLALLNFNLPWPLPILSVGLVEYDTSGVSTINRWESDLWTARVILLRFGYLFATVFLFKCIFKLAIKRIYDLKCKLLDN
ncbi:MAG: hypothetical protein RLZZ107_1260 [Bacteroidota bacterium]